MTAIAIKSRPFNLEHARACAPYCWHDGTPAEILNWEKRPAGWPTLLVNSLIFADERHFVMPPLGFLDDGQPVWTGDPIVPLGQTAPRAALPTEREFAGFTWPAPAKVYPETRMKFDDMCKVWKAEQNGLRHELSRKLTAIANAALRHAIDAGQVVDVDNEAVWPQGRASRAARDMAVAVAVRAACREAADVPGRAGRIESVGAINLAAIIAGVPK